MSDGGVDEISVSEAFAVLGDETRLRIISELGNVGGPGGYEALPFTDLQERVGVADSGRFSYHLDQLRDRFIDRTESGYTLRIPGIHVYQALQAGSYTDIEPIEPIRTEIRCGGGCEAVLTVRYENHRFHLECTTCNGLAAQYPIDPASFGEDLPADILRAADRRLKRDRFSMNLGFCPYCMGAAETESIGQSFQWGREDGLDDPERIGFRQVCLRCGWFIKSRSFNLALVQPTVVGAYADADINVFEVAEWDPDYVWSETVTATDPTEGVLEMSIDGVTRDVLFLAEEGFEVQEVRRPE